MKNDDSEKSSGSEALKDYGIEKVAELTDALRKQYKLSSDSAGLVITEIDKNSPASYEKGLREGDLILQLNMQDLKNTDDLVSALKDADDTIIILVERDGSTHFEMLKKNDSK